MKVGRGEWKWCTAIGVLAVGVFASSLTLRGAMTEEEWSIGGERVTAGKAGVSQAGWQGEVLRVLPPMRADYRKDATMAWRQGALLAIGTWGTSSEGSVASMAACISNEACSDCNACTRDFCTPAQCVGGTLDQEPCSTTDTNTDCENGGGACTPFAEPTCIHINQTDGVVVAGCEDGLYCNGEKTCQGGVCTEGATPCISPQVCDETANACVDSECTSATECDDADDCTEDTCEGGLCVHRDICTPGRCCDNSDVCTAVTEKDCEAAGKVFLGTDQACASLDPSGALNDCPEYAAGITPQGDFTGESPVISNLDCGDILEYVDEYQLDEYPGQQYLSLELLRFAGRVIGENDVRWAIAFYTEGGVLVEDVFWPDGQDQGITDWVINTVDFDPPLVIPAKGKIGFSVQRNFSPGGQAQVRFTDEVDEGTNWGSNEIVALEMVGTYTSEPLGACCDSGSALCTDETSWVCREAGNIFQGVGVPCMVCDTGPNQFEVCAANSDCWACVGGTNAGEPCTSGATCQSGNCSTSAVCVMLPACGKQACCETDGGCVEAVSPDTCPVGTTSLGYGSNCNISGQPAGSRNCCEQAATGADECNGVVLHVMNVPQVGEDPISVTMTGHTGAATHDDPAICNQWSPTGAELGWWEGFSIDDCAMLRIDFCCSDADPTTPLVEAVRPAWGNLVQGCNPCGTLLGNVGVDPPIGIGIGTSGFARGGPFCAEDNLWQTYGPLPAGSYYYPIYTTPGGTTGVPPGGAYQLHVTVGACPVAACCVGDVCQILNQLDCEDAEGYWLAPPNVVTAVVDCVESPCAKGSCCTGPGECTDEITPGVPMDMTTCTVSQGGTYVGGALCDNPTPPCPVCEVESAGNCHLLEDFLVTMSDLSSAGGAVVAADNFIPQGNLLSNVCVMGAYLDGSKADGSYGCSADVTDNFKVRLFLDGGGKPGALVAESAVSTVYRGPEPNSGYEATFGDNTGEGLFAYQLVLANPISITNTGQCHWLEVTNNTAAPEGFPPNTCEWFWSRKGSYDEADGYSFSGTHSLVDDSSVYEAVGERFYDLIFCVDSGMIECAAGDADPERACCTCYDAAPPSQCELTTYGDCVFGSDWDFDAGTCVGHSCPTTAPAGETCEDAIEVSDGVYVFNTICADTNGPNQMINENGGSVGYGSEIWYKYYATCTGRLFVSMCGTGANYDSMIGLFRDTRSPAQGGDPTVCPCPGQPGFAQDGRGSDESCVGIAGGNAGYLKRTVTEGDCWLVSAGGYDADRGPGQIGIECIASACDFSAMPGVGPIPDMGSGTRVRYIGFTAGTAGMSQAIRVKFVDLPNRWAYAEGRTMWVGAPVQVSEVAGKNDATPPTFWKAELQCDPFFTDWSVYPAVYVRSAYLVPGTAGESAIYHVQAIADNCSLGVESDYSDALVAKLTKWGDCVGASNVASPQGVVDFGDISSVVDKFKNLGTAPAKSRVDVAPSLPDMIVDFQDIPSVVDAFRGLLYPYAGPPATNPCP